MNFMSMLKGLGRGIERVALVGGAVVEPILQTTAPFISLVNPAAGAILGKIGTLIAGAETMVTSAQAGALKKQTVSQIAISELPQLIEVIQQFGPNAKIPQAELSKAIDTSVASYNAIAALIQALHSHNAPAVGPVIVPIDSGATIGVGQPNPPSPPPGVSPLS